MWLPVAVWVLVTACSTASPSAPTKRAPRVERLQLGSLEAYALEDGELEVPNDGTLVGVGQSPAELGDLLAAAGVARDTIHLDIQCLLVRAADRVMLFDTGTGDPTLALGGRLAQSLVHAGIAPAAVTDIFISHAHSDHVGGLVTKAGVLAFPSATIHMSALEWAALRANTDDDSKRLVAAISAKVAPFEPGAQVLPAVKAVATLGHTPGHSSYEIGLDEKLFYLGDVAHHSIISVQRPAFAIAVDGDAPAAAAMRQQTLAALAAAHTRVFATHFPFPGVGKVVAEGAGLAWKPEPSR
jgi:glyoxylase-like metal-dependent hydrolase (beta-lactamase superfamily II)